MAAVIACLLDLDSAEDAIQMQEYYNGTDRYVSVMLNWLFKRGYIMYGLSGHSDVKDEFYIVSGQSPRNHKIHHACIYQNGKLYHDPHPDGTGLVSEEYFEVIEKTSQQSETK